MKNLFADVDHKSVLRAIFEEYENRLALGKRAGKEIIYKYDIDEICNTVKRRWGDNTNLNTIYFPWTNDKVIDYWIKYRKAARKIGMNRRDFRKLVGIKW